VRWTYRDPLSVEVEHPDDPSRVLVRVHAEFDFGTAPRRAAALSRLPGPERLLVFDLPGVSFCDSSGLGPCARPTWSRRRPAVRSTWWVCSHR
jgi:hypothetical protein